VGYAIVGDAAGYIYVTGYTLSSDFPTADAFQATWGQGVDIFLTKLHPGVAGPAGLSLSTYFGGTTVNSGQGIAVGADGRMYVGGSAGWELPEANSPDGNVTVLQGFGGGLSDGFIFVLKQ
jgi:hypothetical protein